MSIINLMYLLVGLFIGSVITVLIISFLFVSRDEEDYKNNNEFIKKEFLDKKICPICGYSYDKNLDECPVCNRKFTDIHSEDNGEKYGRFKILQ